MGDRPLHDLHPRRRARRTVVAALAVVLGVVGVGLAWSVVTGSDELERQRAEAQRALREEAEALEAKKRAFAEEQRKRQEQEEEAQKQQEQPRDEWPSDTPLSTLSCEEAHQKLAKSDPVVIEPEVERAIRGRLSRGTYLRDCGVSTRTQVLICAAILEGKAEGVTVQLTPPNDDDRVCLDRLVRRMRFPTCDELLVATTRFR